jgi:hypothetical protein
VTLLRFVIWLVGDEEPLLVDAVNAWAGTLILAVALGLGRQHAPEVAWPRRGGAEDEQRSAGLLYAWSALTTATPAAIAATPATCSRVRRS